MFPDGVVGYGRESQKLCYKSNRCSMSSTTTMYFLAILIDILHVAYLLTDILPQYAPKNETQNLAATESQNIIQRAEFFSGIFPETM